ncbi:MAG: polysaccharide biosynthesis C-terminal domain-containing protein, partial [Sphingomonadaceae bacterium]|nr:polysaccharide biosynthesis C-terminal domain-containing protein [Sphingomonadaceae bacterium]
VGIAALIIPGTIFTRLASNILRGAGKVGASQAIEGPIGTGIAGALLALAMVTRHASDPLLPSILYVAGWTVGVIYALAMMARVMRSWAPPAPFREKLLKSGLPILVANFGNMSIDWFATVLLAATHGPAAAGIFRVGYQIATSVRLLAVTSETILQAPMAASYARGDFERIGSLVRKTVVALLLVSMPLLLAILIAPGWLMGIFGKSFVSGTAAMQVLVVGQIAGLVLSGAGSVLVMAHRENYAVGFTLAGAVLAALLSWLLIPPYGALGAAIATSIPFILIRVAAVAGMRYIVGIPLLRSGVARDGGAGQ